MKNYCTNSNAYFTFKKSATIKRALNKYNDQFNNPLGHMSQEQRDDILKESKKWDPKPEFVYGALAKKPKPSVSVMNNYKDQRTELN